VGMAPRETAPALACLLLIPLGGCSADTDLMALDTETGRLSLREGWGDAPLHLQLDWLGGAAWLEATAAGGPGALDLSAILPQCADTVLQLAAGCGALLTVSNDTASQTLGFTLPELAWSPPDGLRPPAGAGRMVLDAAQIEAALPEPVSTEAVMLAAERGRLVRQGEWMFSAMYTMYATGDIAGRVLDRRLDRVYPRDVVAGQYPVTNAFFDDGTLCFAVGGLPGLNPAYGSCSDRGAAIPPHAATSLGASLHNDLAVDRVHGGRYSLGWLRDADGRSASTVARIPYDADSQSFTGEPPVPLVGLHELFDYDGTEDVYGNSLSIDDGYMCGTVRLAEAGASFGWCVPTGPDGPALGGPAQGGRFEDVILFTRDDFVSSGMVPDGFAGSIVSLPSEAPWPDPSLGPHRVRTFTVDDDTRIALFYALGNQEQDAAVFVLRLTRAGGGWDSRHLCTGSSGQGELQYGDILGPSMFGTAVQDPTWAFGMLSPTENLIHVFDQDCAPLGWWRNTSGTGQWTQTASLMASVGSASGLDSIRVHYDWPAIAALQAQ